MIDSKEYQPGGFTQLNPQTTEHGEKTVMVAKCLTCGKHFHVCAEPYCYSDRDWLKSLKKYSKINTVEVSTIKLKDLDFEINVCCGTELKIKL